jgi:hypothetical protein
MRSLGIAERRISELLGVNFKQDVPANSNEAIKQSHCDNVSEQSDIKRNSPPEGYRLKYPEAQTAQGELEEIVARVHGEEGYVLLWSTVLQDLIAFYRDEEAKNKIPVGFVPYSEVELKELFGDGKPPLSAHTLRLIHEAKKHCGQVTSWIRKDDNLPDF